MILVHLLSADAGHLEGGWPWAPLAFALWLTAAAAVAWFVVRRTRPRDRSGVDRAKDVLAERYARGELTIDEYRERLDALEGRA
jgi:putative membrane protein